MGPFRSLIIFETVLLLAIVLLLIVFAIRLKRPSTPFLRALAVLGIVNAAVILIAVPFFASTDTDSRKAMTAVYGGPENLEIILHPDRVQVYQLVGAGAAREDIPEYLKKRLGYSVLRGPVAAGSILRGVLVEELTDPRKIKHYGRNLCIFEPDYLFSFARGDDTIEILWSVSYCPEFRVFRNGTSLAMRESDLDRGFPDTVISGMGYYVGDFRYLSGILDSTMRPYLADYAKREP